MERDFEDFLREFRPRAPRPLPSQKRPARLWFAAAAILLVAVGLRIWPRPEPGTPTPEPKPSSTTTMSARSTLGRMRFLASREPDRLDRLLEMEGRTSLPDVQAGEGALQHLAKDWNG